MKINNKLILIVLSIAAFLWLVYEESKTKLIVIEDASSITSETDTDADGVVDAKDHCPEVAGEITLYGCSDTDGDGVSDSDDLCPLEKGTVENKGCAKIVAPVKKLKKRNEEDAANKLVVISYKGEKYEIQKGFTSKEGKTFNGSNWRYLGNLLEKREVSKKVNWKVASQKDFQFFFNENAKKIVQKKETKENVISITKKEKELSLKTTKIADRSTDGDVKDANTNRKSEDPFSSVGVKSNVSLKKELEDMFYKMIINPTITTKQANNWKKLYRRFVNENELKDLKVEKWNQEILHMEVRD